MSRLKRIHRGTYYFPCVLVNLFPSIFDMGVNKITFRRFQNFLLKKISFKFYKTRSAKCMVLLLVTECQKISLYDS